MADNNASTAPTTDVPDVTSTSPDVLQKAVAGEAKGFSATVSDAMDTVKNANTGLSAVISQATGSTKDAYSNIFEALQQKQKIDALPAFVTNIWGMFDSSMNSDVQDDKIKQGTTKLSQINTEVDQAAKARDAIVQNADADVKTGQARLSAASQILGSLATVSGIKESGARTRQIIANTQEIMQTFNHNQEQYTAHQYTPEQLANAAAGKDPKVAAGTAQDVLAQKDNLQTQVAAAGLALRAGKVAFAEQVRQNILTKSMDYQGDLIPLAAKMHKDNMETMDLTDPRSGEKVTITRGEVDKAVATGYHDFIEQQNKQAEVAGIGQSITSTAAAVDAKRSAGATLAGGVLTDEQQAQVDAFNKRRDTAIQMRAFPEADKVMKEELAFWDAQKKKYADSASDLEKPAINQLFDNGKLTNKAATDYSFANAQLATSQSGTPFEMFENAFGTSLTSAMRSQADMMRISLGANGARPGGNLSIADLFAGDDKEKNRSEIIAKLLSPSNEVTMDQGPGKPKAKLYLADVYRNGVAEDYATKLLQKLGQPAIAGTDAQSPFAKFLDEDGKIAKAYRQADGTFNMGLLAQHLEDQTIKMKAANALQPDQDLAVIFYKALQTYTKDYSDNFLKTADVNRRVYNQLINGDKPMKGFETQLDVFKTGLSNYGQDEAQKKRNSELLSSPTSLYEGALMPGWTK